MAQNPESEASPERSIEQENEFPIDRTIAHNPESKASPERSIEKQIEFPIDCFFGSDDFFHEYDFYPYEDFAVDNVQEWQEWVKILLGKCPKYKISVNSEIKAKRRQFAKLQHLAYSALGKDALRNGSADFNEYLEDQLKLGEQGQHRWFKCDPVVIFDDIEQEITAWTFEYFKQKTQDYEQRKTQHEKYKKQLEALEQRYEAREQDLNEQDRKSKRKLEEATRKNLEAKQLELDDFKRDNPPLKEKQVELDDTRKGLAARQLELDNFKRDNPPLKEMQEELDETRKNLVAKQLEVDDFKSENPPLKRKQKELDEKQKNLDDLERNASVRATKRRRVSTATAILGVGAHLAVTTCGLPVGLSAALPVSLAAPAVVATGFAGFAFAAVIQRSVSMA